MEVRKVQITGGSTFTVSLPKEWATDSGIEAGSELAFYPEGEALITTPLQATRKESVRINAADLSPNELRSQLITLYINGFSEIDLEDDTIDTDRRQVARRVATELVGFEISSETDDRVVLKDFLDPAELSVHSTVMRMRLLALSMLEDSMATLLEQDTEQAMSVIERDDDVDQLWYVVSRVFRAVLHDPQSVAAIDVTRETCFDYRSCARQLERIADHTVKIAVQSHDIDRLPESTSEPLAELEAAACTIVEDAVDAFLVDDSERAMELATDVLTRTDEMDNYVRSIEEQLREAEPLDAQQLGLIVDSLLRIGDYGGNIAETALQKAAPSPSM